MLHILVTFAATGIMDTHPYFNIGRCHGMIITRGDIQDCLYTSLDVVVYT